MHMIQTFSSIQKAARVLGQTHRYMKLGEDSDGQLVKLKSRWAREILKLLNIEVTISGKVNSDPSLIFVGNHISYLDLILILATVPESSFVSKSEVANWPLFGRAAKLLDTIFVKRECADSRNAARDTITSALQVGKRIVLFPSGTTTLDEKKMWRKGAFEIAHANGLKIQPFRIEYDPLRTAAYIDNDLFLAHLIQIAKQPLIRASIEFHEPVNVTEPFQDSLFWQKWARKDLSHVGNSN
jgi:1-acyl-sn-glycerol-3-phosphate acyltransferase